MRALSYLTKVLATSLALLTANWQCSSCSPGLAEPVTNSTVSTQVILHSNQSYVSGHGSSLQRLDIYSPKYHSKKLPVIIYIHGGGFCHGDKTSSVVSMPQVFTSKGFIFVSIDYRLSPAFHFPAHVEDLASAISWVHKSIGNYGGDPSKIFLLGHSAGAQLACLVSTDQRYLLRHGLKLKVVSGVVMLDGGALDVAASLLTDKKGPINSPAFGSNPAVWRQASPIYHIARGKGIPPFLIYYLPYTIQSTEQNTKLISRLRKADVPVDVHIIENKNHREINEALGNVDDPEGQQIVRFMNDVSK